jgi:hypothetical protein
MMVSRATYLLLVAAHVIASQGCGTSHRADARSEDYAVLLAHSDAETVEYDGATYNLTVNVTHIDGNRISIGEHNRQSTFVLKPGPHRATLRVEGSRLVGTYMRTLRSEPVEVDFTAESGRAYVAKPVIVPLNTRDTTQESLASMLVRFLLGSDPPYGVIFNIVRRD